MPLKLGGQHPCHDAQPVKHTPRLFKLWWRHSMCFSLWAVGEIAWMPLMSSSTSMMQPITLQLHPHPPTPVQCLQGLSEGPTHLHIPSGGGGRGAQQQGGVCAGLAAPQSAST